MNIIELQRKLQINFEDEGLLLKALTHRSFSYEAEGEIGDNERLEYLGDSVLNLIISEYLYHRYPELLEGDLTKLRAVVVRRSTLAKISRELELGKYIRLGEGERASGGRERSSNLADALEAVIAAIFLDQGWQRTKDFIIDFFKEQIEDIVANKRWQDYKSYLQELIQRDLKRLPEYEIIDTEGPDHDKTFFGQVKVGGKVLGKGIGKSKKKAEQAAAKEACSAISKKKHW